MTTTRAELDHGGNLPVRKCHGGCKGVDDHPRLQIWNDLGNTDRSVEVFHYDDDCLPVERLSAETLRRIEPIRQARRDGKRGQALREVAEQHAASIAEEPAHEQES